MCRALLVGTLASPPGLGCVLPVDLEPAGADAGASSPPVITSAAAPYAFPGPILISRDDPQPIGLIAVDNDLTDSLFVNFYVDYGRTEAQPAFGSCQSPPVGARERSFNCATNSLCNLIDAEDTGDHVLEAMIADRPFLSDGDPAAFGQPEFRALTDWPRVGFSISSWVMRCQPAQ